MKKTIESYSHFVIVDEETRVLTINRFYANGRHRPYTSVELPTRSFRDDEKGFRDFARRLGENLPVDSPIARKLLGL